MKRVRNSWKTEGILADANAHNEALIRSAREVVAEWNASVEKDGRRKKGIASIKEHGFTGKSGIFSRIDGGTVAEPGVANRG